MIKQCKNCGGLYASGQPEIIAGTLCECRLSAAPCYRLLDCNDEIRGDDEFLDDDAITWTRIDLQHSWNIGTYWHTALKPMRRILCDNTQDHE